MWYLAKNSSLNCPALLSPVPYLPDMSFSCKAYPDAGQGRFLCHHPTTSADHRTYHPALEATLPYGWTRWPRHLPSRPVGHGVDARSQSPHPIGHPQETQRWFYPLELPQAGGLPGHQQRCRTSRLGKKLASSPTKLRRYMASDDPDFERKAADIIGLFSTRRSMRPSSASTRRPPFRR